MKNYYKFLLSVSILIVIIISCGNAKDNSYTIKIKSATNRLEFSGSYMVTTMDGKVISKSVDGVAPQEYSVKGTMISCSFQKKTEDGNLTVEIWKGKKYITGDDTIADYGIVALATQ